MKKLLIVALTVLGTSLSTTLYANQGNEDKVAMMELEKDYLVLVSEPKQKKQQTNNTDDEPDCD